MFAIRWSGPMVRTSGAPAPGSNGTCNSVSKRVFEGALDPPQAPSGSASTAVAAAVSEIDRDLVVGLVIGRTSALEPPTRDFGNRADADSMSIGDPTDR